jgi:hypothetical protein
MRKINEIAKRYDFKPTKYMIKGKTTLIDTDKGRFAIKAKNRSQNNQILTYLDSRSFHYYPNIIQDDDEYIITEAIDEIDMPSDQKMADLIDLVALLHSKTTHYKEVDLDDYKKLYEDISNNIVYLSSYYEDYVAIAESHVFMSPSEYLLARNSTKIYSSLQFAKAELEKWYEMIKEKRKQRLVVLHNNLNLDHFLRSKSPYLISWDQSKIGIPVFDIFKLYKRQGLDFEFGELLRRYERTYPLLPEERKLLFILLAMPNKIEFHDSEYEMCMKISRLIDELYKTEMIISPYYSKQTEQKEQEKQK